MSASEDRQNEIPENGIASSSTENSETPAVEVAASGPQLYLAPEDYPKIDHLITEDDTPVDSVYHEKQQRLLTEPLYSSWAGPGKGRPFVAMANVGLFFVPKNPALVPDMLLSVGVQFPEDIRAKNHRSYFIWEYTKPPDLVLEIVSDRTGDEDTLKKETYAWHRVPYYAIYDPDNLLKGGVLRAFELHPDGYVPRPDAFFPVIELGLTFWEGEYEGTRTRWLRWCDREGKVIPTGRERAEQEKQHAELEKQRAELEKQRAEQAQRELATEKERAKRLQEQLKALGIKPVE